MSENGSLYLLDANTLITSQHVYYPNEMVPELWTWLLYQAMNNRIKMPAEIYEEVLVGKDDLLTSWLKKPEVKNAILLDEQVDPHLVQYVVETGYAPDLDENEIAAIGMDPFLISYALAQQGARCVVSLEASKPSAQRKNRRVPDVCKDLGSECCNMFVLLRKLGFHTGWERAV